MPQAVEKRAAIEVDETPPNIRNKLTRGKIYSGVFIAMPARGWRSYSEAERVIVSAAVIAAAIAVLVAIPHLAGVPSTPGIDQYAQQNRGKGEGALTGKNKETTTYDPGCPYPKNRDDADLCEQRRMAKAAEEAVALAESQWWLTILNLTLLSAATVAAIAAAIYASRAADAGSLAVAEAKDTNAITDRSAKQQLRAYIGVAGATVSKLNAGERCRATFTICNAGQTPATITNCWYACNSYIVEHPPDLSSIRGPDETSNFPLGPQEKFVLDVPTRMPVTPEQIVLINSGEAVMQFLAKITYLDAFGHTRITAFNYRYSRRDDGLAVLLRCMDGNEAD